jgi:NitT/TauT family transport system substrate-binding protein
MTHKSYFKLVILLILISACSQGLATDQQPTDVNIPIRLTMGYRPDIQFAPLYVAKEEGYFAEFAIEVEFNHIPETDAVQLVGAGELQFAIVSGEQVLLARAQGLPVVYVMAWWQDYPVAIASSTDLGVVLPSDLIGKRVGIPGLYGASYIGYRALLSAAGVDEGDIQLDAIGYNQVAALYEGQEDAVVIYANNEPIQLEAQGFPVNVIRVADYVHLSSNGLITSEMLIEQNPDLVRRMIEATLRGMQESIANPSRAYEISKRYVEGLDQADQTVQRGILEASIPFWEAEPLGFSDSQSWENMHKVLLEMGLLAEPLELDRAFTNQFLP